MQPFRHTLQRAFTLLELTVVMAVFGFVAIVGSTLLNSQGVVGGLQAREDAQIIATACRMARNTAIANGTNVRIDTIQSGRRTLGFQLTTDTSPVSKLQPDYYFADSLDVQWSAPSVVFFPTGMTDRSLSIAVTSETSAWILDVRSASGQVTLSKKE